MGTDTPLAVLSDRPQLLYDYFKQLFAQVTNPPLDAIREELVTSMESTVGPERNLLRAEPEACRQIAIRYPIIDNDQLAKLRHIDSTGLGFRSITLPMLYRRRTRAAPASSARMDRLCREAQAAVEAGHTILILSDRGVSPGLAPIPSLLATAGVHHHLVRRGHAHAVRARSRIRRCARGAPCGAPHRLRRGRGQPVPRVRDARRHDSPARARGFDARARGRQLHQGAQQGHPESDVEDGDLDAAELLRRADLRGHRPRRQRRRPLLHVDGVAHRRRRHRRHRSRDQAPPSAGVPAQVRPAGARNRRRVPAGAAMARCTSSTRKRCTSCSMRPAAASTPSTRTTRRSSTIRAAGCGTLRGLLEFTAGAAADPARRGRAGRGDSQAVRHRRDVLRLDQPGSARDDRDRDEPHGRQVEHRRRRRRSRPLSPRCERRFQAQRDQAGRVGAVRRDLRVPRQRR